MANEDLRGPLEHVTDCFLNATQEVDEIYFQLKVSGIEHAKFLERVYCYELYHQMRIRWPKVPHSLTGEIDKSGHPRVREGILNRSKPDFTIHIPGSMENNLLVIEVKARDPVDADVLRDLEKLTAFREYAEYHAAYYLTYGFNADEAAAFASNCRVLAHTNPRIDLTRIVLYNQISPKTAALVVPWK